MHNKFLKNNFDLIRLFAAFQVALAHVFHVMEIKTAWVGSFILHMLYLFPGVPIFFFISGFLISRSYEKNSCLKEFFINRVLRLYPGLIVCVAFSIILVMASGYLQGRGVQWYQLAALFLEKITFFQFYNPEFMRAYGDGVLNGSLWTITVEIQFYLLIPVMFFILSRKPPNCTANCALVVLTVLFFILNRLYAVLPDMAEKSLITKLIKVSFFPWFYIFLLGVLAQRNFEFFHAYLAGKFYFIFPIYLVSAYMLSNIGSTFGNNSNPVVIVLLLITVFSFAYSMPALSAKVLKGNDMSYGIYIYHMPVVNLLLYNGLYRKAEYGFVALTGSILLAVISWFLIEKPALRLKRHPLFTVSVRTLSDNPVEPVPSRNAKGR
jgi:peptidoglycan/LPS O-acetylase OafA/YrhL